MKVHITPDGKVLKCTASKQACKYAVDENGHRDPTNKANHFRTKVEALAYIEKRNSDAYGQVQQLKKENQSLKERERELRDANSRLLKEKLSREIRVNNFNPNKGNQLLLRKAIEKAEKRGNTHLMEKLSQASVIVYPGKIFPTDKDEHNLTDGLKAIRKSKQWDSDRAKYAQELSKLAQGETGVLGNTYKYSGENIECTMDIKPSFDQAEFDKLSDDFKNAIKSKYVERPDINKLRQLTNADAQSELRLSKEDYNKIVNNSRVVDYVGLSDSIKSSSLSLDNSDTMQDGFDRFVEKTSERKYKDKKTIKQLKEEKESFNNDIKKRFSDRTTNVFIPINNDGRGILVSSRQTVNRKEAESILSDKQLKYIQSGSLVVDEQKAKSILSPERYDEIFSKPKVQLKVVEK